MTVAELILRVRAVFNETGTVSGFLTDDNLKKYIDSAQNTIIDRLINLQKNMRQIKPFYETESLKILITLFNFDIVGNIDTYLFADLGIEDYKENYDLQVDLNASGTKKGATYKNMAEIKWNNANLYNAGSFNYPYYTINNSSEIFVSPTPANNQTGGADFRYYRKPEEVAAAQELTLQSETHEAILYKTLSLAYDQDKEITLSNKYSELFEKHLATIK